jgi:hypothetical protein
MRRVRITTIVVEKQYVLHIPSVYLQRARAVLSTVVCPVLQYFSRLSRKRRDFRVNVFAHKIVFIFPTTTA